LYLTGRVDLRFYRPDGRLSKSTRSSCNSGGGADDDDDDINGTIGGLKSSGYGAGHCIGLHDEESNIINDGSLSNVGEKGNVVQGEDHT